MKNIRKTIGVILLVLLVCSTSTVFAVVPSLTVLIGNKAYHLDYANDTKNRKEILEAIKECVGGEIYIKLTDVWLDNITKKKVANELIPMLEYKDQNGIITRYEAQDGDAIKEENNSNNDSNDNSGGENNNGGGSTPGESVSKEDFKITIGHVYLDNEEKRYAQDIEDKNPKYDYYEVNVSDIGENQILGLDVEFPKNIKKFKAYLPASNDKVILEREIVNGKVKIDCRDKEFSGQDEGKPGISLKKLQENAGSFSLNGDFIDVNVELVDENGNRQTAKIILRVK